MKKISIKCLLAGMLLAVAGLAQPCAATTVGYTDGTCIRKNLFRMGTTTKQGLAIKLSADKLKALKGQTITSIDASFGSRNTTENSAHLFIATTPDGQPLREQTVTISKAVQWLNFQLDSPYTITGEEESLYIGYTAEIEKTYNLFMADFNSDMRDCCFAYKDGAWVDLCGMGYGGVNIRAVLDGDIHFTDVILKPFSADAYYKVGTPYVYTAQLFNFGTETVSSFDVAIATDSGTPLSQRYEGLSIAPGSSYDIVLPEYVAAETRKSRISVEVSNINGAADTDMSDNVFAADVFFYPSDMERCVLLEGFTGQTCSNCPAGHQEIAKALGATDMPVAEVMHHSGYYPDMFTMDADMDYTFFYSGSSYAPAVMLNRTTNPAASSVPVMQANSLAILSTFDMIAASQPYVSLKLATDYDAASREAKVRFTAYVHNDLPAGQNLFNVVLTQDNIKGGQSNGGSEYNHTMVFRGTLTGNAWGIFVPADKAVAGSTFEWETTFSLPEAIFSDYWAAYDEATLNSAGYTTEMLTIATVPEDMYVTAYVGAYEKDNVDGNGVYNCVQVKLGENRTQDGLTAVASPVADRAGKVNVSVAAGRISVTGADSYAVYNAAGRRVPSDSRLGSGLYIVRATAAGQTMTRKVVVR